MTTVPLSSLSQSDDAGEAVAPEVGDVIDLGKARARVDSIDGDSATLVLTEVNGEAVEAPASDEAEAPDDGEDDNGMEAAVNDAGNAAMRKNLMRKMRSADKKSGF